MIKAELEALRQAVKIVAGADLQAVDLEQSGTVISLDSGIAVIRGLMALKNLELVEFPGGTMGMAYNLDRDVTGVILLGDYDHINSGDRVKRTGQVVEVPVSLEFIGRVITPLGIPIDGSTSVVAEESWPIERESPPIMNRDPVTRPLQTGIKVIDAVVPVGRGQRELIVGDRQTGKTAIAVDTIINQKHENVICIYCAIGH